MGSNIYVYSIYNSIMCTRICIWKNRPICTLYTMDWLYRAIQSRYTDTFVKYTIPAQLAFDSLSSITWWRMVCWKDLQNSRLNFFTESYIHSRIVSNMPFVMLNMYFVCPSGCRRFDCKQKGEIKKKKSIAKSWTLPYTFSPCTLHHFLLIFLSDKSIYLFDFWPRRQRRCCWWWRQRRRLRKKKKIRHAQKTCIKNRRHTT